MAIIYFSASIQGPPQQNRAAAAENIWERLISELSRADRAGGGCGGRVTPVLPFTSTGNLTEAKGAETADERPAGERMKAHSVLPLSSNRYQDISHDNHIIPH